MELFGWVSEQIGWDRDDSDVFAWQYDRCGFRATATYMRRNSLARRAATSDVDTKAERRPAEITPAVIITGRLRMRMLTSLRFSDCGPRTERGGSVTVEGAQSAASASQPRRTRVATQMISNTAYTAPNTASAIQPCARLGPQG